MNDSLLRVTRDHRKRLCISFADEVDPQAIADFLRDEFGARLVERSEHPLGDSIDLDLRIGWTVVTLISAYWGGTLMSTTRLGNPTISRVARRLRKWEAPAAGGRREMISRRGAEAAEGRCGG